MPNQVSLWAGSLGWIRVQPSDIASFDLPNRIAPHEGLLKCEECNNYVQLTDVLFGIHQPVPFFTHGAGNWPYGGTYGKTESAPDGFLRQKGARCRDNVGGGVGIPIMLPPPPDPEKQDIPVYLAILGHNAFEWEVKLPAVTKEVGGWTENDRFRISFGVDGDLFFPFHISRTEGVRFRLGGDPSQNCTYEVKRFDGAGNWNPVTTAPENWRLNRQGCGSVQLFREEGWAAFSGMTKRLLPKDSDVGIGETVYIVSRQRIHAINIIRCDEIGKQNGWHLFEVKATQCSQGVATWFRGFGLNLTSVPTRFFPIWPPSVSSPNLRQHRNEEMFFFLEGTQSAIRLWPPVYWTTPSESGETKGVVTTALVHIKIDPKQNPNSRTFCSLVADRNGTLLQSEFLWFRDPLSLRLPVDSIRVENAETGEAIENESKNRNAPSNLRLVAPEFDGFVLVRKTGGETARTEFKGGDSELRFPAEGASAVSVFFAKDCVWSATFGKQKQGEPEHQALPRRVATRGRIPFSHAMGGAILHRLGNSNEWRKTIRAAAYCGWIDANDFAQLQTQLQKRGTSK